MLLFRYKIIECYFHNLFYIEIKMPNRECYKSCHFNTFFKLNHNIEFRISISFHFRVTFKAKSLYKNYHVKTT